MFNKLFGYDTNFESAIKIVLNHEGLLSDNPNDPGGITKYGISIKFLRAAGIDENGTRCNHITAQDIKALTPNQAKNIYYKYYWIKYNINNVKSLRIATSILDMSILMGNKEAILCIQRAINNLYYTQKLYEDGIMGSSTLKMINSDEPSSLINQFKIELKNYIDLISSKNQKLLIFKEGWYNRINSL